MCLLNTKAIFITLAVLLNSIERSSQSLHAAPFIYGHPRSPSYVIENGLVHLVGESVGGEAVVIDGYFLGTWEHNEFHAVDPFNEYSLIFIRTGRLVTVSEEFKSRLLLNQALRSARNNFDQLRRSGAHPRNAGHRDPGPSNAGHRDPGPSNAGHRGDGR